MFGLTPFNRSVTRLNDTDPFRNLIDDFFNDAMPMRVLRNDTFKIDVREENDTYVVEADLPGFKKDNIRLSYEDGDLTIEAKAEEEKKEDKKTYLHRERRQCQMRRTIHLGELDPDKIEASLKDGILTITAHKAQVIENKRQITIK
jgi:HSP20 family protein